MEFSDSPSTATTSCTGFLFSLRHSLFKNQDHTSLGDKEHNRIFEQTEHGNASCSAKQNDVMALKNNTLCRLALGKMQMQHQKAFENARKNDGETASKCLLISFKSSCWTTGIYVCYKERHLPKSKFTFIFIISFIGASM